ncbi:MAG TPA: RNA polymerase sigma factor [Solirubrobacteraceae bacterium]|jgi:RNA polymerase sigma factor (sigma-70 family)|nr:RNA polymerase sigma factor [Solirubrobacteraceae bacterium]
MDDVAPGAGPLSDGELLDSTRAGDPDAFGLLYERRHDLVLAFLVKRTRNPEVAMDLVAETFAAALIALAERPPAIARSAAPWLLTIARNALIDSYRRGRVESAARQRLALEPVQITDSDIERVLQVAAETDLLARLADELPADQFQALRARVLDERSYEEIAQHLECSAAVVRKRVSRAISTLRRASQASA